jgi:hypothetical protein
MLARVSLAPGLQASLLAVRVGLLWLMLVVVLGLRSARAFAQSESTAASGERGVPPKDAGGTPPDSTRPNA